MTSLQKCAVGKDKKFNCDCVDTSKISNNNGNSTTRAGYSRNIYGNYFIIIISSCYLFKKEIIIQV